MSDTFELEQFSPHVGPGVQICTQERLDKPSQFVDITNTSARQRHIVIDRRCVGREIMPGQTVNIEMLDEDIQYFVEQRKPGRKDGAGRLLPQHPLFIHNVGAAGSAVPEAAPSRVAPPVEQPTSAPVEAPAAYGHTAGQPPRQGRSK